MLGGHSRILAVRVMDIDIIWVLFKEFQLNDQGLYHTGSDMTLEEHGNRSQEMLVGHIMSRSTVEATVWNEGNREEHPASTLRGS